jgi:hypothetical protein
MKFTQQMFPFTYFPSCLNNFQMVFLLCFFCTQVFNCPIRSDSAAVLLELDQSSHDLVCPHTLEVTSYAVVSSKHIHSSCNISWVKFLYISSNITTHSHTSGSVLAIMLPKAYVLADLLVAITCEELQ